MVFNIMFSCFFFKTEVGGVFWLLYNPQICEAPPPALPPPPPSPLPPLPPPLPTRSQQEKIWPSSVAQKRQKYFGKIRGGDKNVRYPAEKKHIGARILQMHTVALSRYDTGFFYSSSPKNVEVPRALTINQKTHSKGQILWSLGFFMIGNYHKINLQTC